MTVSSRFATLFLTAALGLGLAACSSDETPATSTDANGGAGLGAGSGGALDSGAGGNGLSSARPGSLEDFRQNVGDRVFFSVDQYTLSPEARDTLQKQVAFIKQYAANNKVTIEGHCDERGTREYNLALGARRANAVKNFLIQSGISSKQLHVISFGKERPEETGSDETAWAKNRRAVTVLVDFNS